MKKLIAAVTAVGVLPLTIVGCSTEADPKILAKNECLDQVKDRMKDPGSTEFGEPVIEDRGSGIYKIEGTMRSRNSFGALTPGRYGCVISMTGQDAKVELVRVK